MSDSQQQSSGGIIDINGILACLPQRPPFLMIDRVIAMTPAKCLTALKNVSMNEPYFVGHFPGQPVMPGVLILEAIAQASTVLAVKSLPPLPPNKRVLFLFAGIDNVRFKRMVIPGDQLKIDVEFLKMKSRLMKIQSTVTVDHEVVCTAELMSVGKEQDCD